jgi:hypothetical protein
MSDDLSSSSSSLGAAAPTLQAARRREPETIGQAINAFVLQHGDRCLQCGRGVASAVPAAIEDAVLAERAACAALVEQWGECASDADRKRAAAIDQGDAVDANAQYARGAAFRACAAALDARNQR